MASETDRHQPDTAVAASPDALTVNLQVLSPSVGVSRPLLFPTLPASTTIKQLKEKIRQTLPLRPADENQRFIHRGRAILRETDTLLDIFGADTLHNPEQQTIHLVIRETTEPPAPTSSAGVRGRSLSPATQLPNLPRQHVTQQPPLVGPQVPPGFARRNITQSNPHLPMPRGASPARPPVPEQQPAIPGAAAFQHAMAHQQALLQQHHQQQQQHHIQHQNMTQWLTQVQRESMARQLIAQNQRNRAQLGMRGIGDAGANGVPGPEPTSGRASPAPGHTVVREAWGPNGRTYQVETIIRSPAPNPQQGLSPTDVQNILRGADANQATAAMTTAMQRSASGASLHNRPLTQPGVTTPMVVPGFAGSHPPSGRVTPDLGYRFANHVNTTLPLATQTAPRQGLEVYILSSPEGPRALLVNNNTAETYYTPMMRSQPSRSFHDLVNVGHDTQPQRQPDELHQPPPVNLPHQTNPQPQQLTPEQQQEQQQQLQQHLRNGVAGVLHPHNPQVGAAGPRVIQAWPHIWMLLRLIIVVWLFTFTTPNLSWTQWSIMVCLAVCTFIMSTGLLNGMAERVWQPVARHLENLIRPVDQRPGGGANGQPGAQQGEPDPAQMAARLLAEQRARETWVAGQVRRLERAGLLFLASIAPGVAERHIANLEAEARAERQRREEEEAAAARAAEEAAAAAAAAAEGNEANTEGEKPSGEDTSDTRPEASSVEAAEPDVGGQNDQQEAQAAREPLIAL